MISKKIFIIKRMIICAFLLVLLLLAISATEIFTTETSAAEIGESAITVGYYEDYVDFVDDIHSLNSTGYGYEIFQKIEEVSDLRFEYIPISGSSKEALENGIIDLFCFNTKNPEREEEFLFSKFPYGDSNVMLVTTDMEMLYADFDSLDGKRVATYENNEANRFLDSLGKYFGFSIDYIYGEEHNYMTLDADFYIMYSEDRNLQSYNNVLNLGVFDLYVMSTFEQTELMSTMDSIFYDIIATEGNFFSKLEDKYYDENNAIIHRGLNNLEVEQLRERTLEVGYMIENEPISYTNEQGEPAGALVDIFNSFVSRYDFEVNYHEYSITDEPETYAHLDILLSLYGKGDEQRKYFDSTETAYSFPMYAQVRVCESRTFETLEETILQSSRIGTLRYQTIDFGAFTNHFPDNEFIFYDNLDTLINGFAEEEVDMIISTDVGLTYSEFYLEEMDKIVVYLETQIPVQLFINKNIAEEYVPIFNVVINRMSQDRYTTIIEKNSNEFFLTKEINALEIVKEYWYWIVLFFLVLLGIFGIWEIQQQKSQQKALKVAYETDSLTGLITINKFHESINEVLKYAKAGEYELFSFDMDMFRSINANYSIDKGTDILKGIAESLKAAFLGTEAIITRRSADQFLIFRKIDEGGSIRLIYTKYILPSIEQRINKNYHVSLSFGHVIVERVNEVGTAIIGQADNARISGKSIHKTSFITFDDKMHKKYQDKIEITFHMEEALQNCEFFIEYQPKISFASLEVGGAEALVRWCTKEGKRVLPDEFIPIFEENGFISDLDLYVLEGVCLFMKENMNQIEIPTISVNLSAHTILEEGIVERIKTVVSRYDIPIEKLEFELTESAIESDTIKFLTVVKGLKKLGFSISIDDFGAGVSSLNRLSAVEADVLKLDKVFFDINDQTPKSTIVVTDVISMAKHLNMKVVAEGVETLQQAIWLKGIGCDYAQGYYFSKPIGEEDFKKLLLSGKHYHIDSYIEED